MFKSKINYLLVISFLILAGGFKSFGQSTPYNAQTISNKINNYFEVLPAEKIYLDIDKSSYVSGDTIWFKVYSTAGFYNQLSPLSGLAYLNLINQEDSVISEAKVKLESGLGNGFILLPKELATDNYQLVSFTQWMLNAQGSVFAKEISVTNLFQRDAERQEAIGNEESIAFYPEGGHLISSKLNRVAFESNFLQMEDTILLMNSKLDTLSTFTINKFNRGSFSFVPEAKENYFVKMAGNEKRFNLPDASSSGVGIYLVNLKALADIRFKVYRSKDLAIDRVSILCHNNGKVLYAADAAFNANDEFVGLIQKQLLGPGVNHLVIFSDKGQVLSERAVFMDNSMQLEVNSSIDKDTYSKKEKASLEISTSLKGKQVPANLSVSIVKSSLSWNEATEDNIISYLLLTNRLKGTVQNPWYFFHSEDEDRYKVADELMMVNGWSKYEYADYLNDSLLETKSNFQIEKGLKLSGHLTKANSDKKVTGSINYFISSEENQFGTVQTDENGDFLIQGIDFYGESTITLNAKNNKGRTSVQIVLDSANKLDFSPKYNETLAEEVAFAKEADVKEAFNYQEIAKTLNMEGEFELMDEVRVNSFRETEAEKVNNIFGKGDYTLDVTELPITETVSHPLELVRGRVPGVIVRGSINSWQILIRGVGSVNSSTSPVILVDNVEVNIDFLNTLSPKQIEQVEVYSGASAAIFGARGANGVLAFFTKTGRIDPKEIETPNNLTIDVEGYQKRAEFYKVIHDNNKANTIPDYRTVLLWEPDLNTSETENSLVKYYTSDVPGEYTIVIEGITKTGQLGFTTQKFQVK